MMVEMALSPVNLDNLMNEGIVFATDLIQETITPLFAKARVGRWLGRGSVTHWNVDATSQSFDRPVLEHNHRASYRVPRGCDRGTNYGHDRW